MAGRRFSGRSGGPEAGRWGDPPQRRKGWAPVNGTEAFSRTCRVVSVTIGAFPMPAAGRTGQLRGQNRDGPKRYYGDEHHESLQRGSSRCGVRDCP